MSLCRHPNEERGEHAGVSLCRHPSEEKGQHAGVSLLRYPSEERGEHAGVNLLRHPSEERKCWSHQRLRGYLAPDRLVTLISSYHSLLAR